MLASADFNSIKVRLELLPASSPSPLSGFQFHKGAIRTAGSRGFTARHSYFNSIKVRLEPAEPQTGTPAKEFQFHKGAIRT